MGKKVLEFVPSLKKVNGIWFDPEHPVDRVFESHYLAVREKENRVFTDEQVAVLPKLKGHHHTKEWKMRAKSALRVKRYFEEKKVLATLDLGCGNGWFSAQLADIPGTTVTGLDINRPELEQAGRVFKKPNLDFVMGDIFRLDLPPGSFDMITLNAAVQYFSDLKKLAGRLFDLLGKSGEIHLIDSPFYVDKEKEKANQRSRDYYTSLGFPEMARHYFHHTYEEISGFNYEILYNPVGENRLKQLIKGREIPFPWIRIRK